MVQVQSTWFPLIDRNPQKFVPNIFQAKESDFHSATQRIYRTQKYPSSVAISVMPAGARADSNAMTPSSNSAEEKNAGKMPALPTATGAPN